MTQQFGNVVEGGLPDEHVETHRCSPEFSGKDLSGYKKKAELALGRAGETSFDFAQDRLCPYVVCAGYYLLSESSLASFILADSSFFWTRATSFWSTSAATVLFHSEMARSQCAAASLRRPVFW